MKRNLSIKLIITLIFLSGSASWQALADVCWKPTYGRGVGEIPGHCDTVNQTKSGLLCYVRAKPGQTNVAGVVWQDCPSGFTDQGAFCRKPAPSEYGRGAGYPWKFGDALNLDGARKRCAVDNKQGCEQSGLIIYPKCGPGYHAVGCCMCSRDCPDGMPDAGLSCTKQSYVVSPQTPTCSPGQQYDAGLCYKQCETSYSGVGPVCWGSCPKDMVDCGAMCGKSAQECAESIGNQVWAVGSVIYKIVGLVATMGASGSFSGAVDVFKNSAANAIKEVAKRTAKELAKVSAKQLTAALASVPGMDAGLADSSEKMLTDPEGFDYMSFVSNIDPTGLVAAGQSFNIGICKMDKPVPKDMPLPPKPKDAIPDVCAKMQAIPDYKYLANKPSHLLSLSEVESGRKIINQIVKFRPDVLKKLVSVDISGILRMDCNIMRKDPNFVLVASTPVNQWTKETRDMAIVVVRRAINSTIQNTSRFNNNELMGIMRSH